LKNYCTLTDLKSYFPEIEDFLHTGETNFDKFKDGATLKVITDIKNKGYDLRQLQTPLNLLDDTLIASDVTEADEDSANRMRLVYNVIAYTGVNSFTLQGANENNDDTDWNDIETVTVTTTGESSLVFSEAYKYYRISYTIGTSLEIKINLVETNYDILFCFKQLEMILLNAHKKSGEQAWWDKMLYFREEYNENLGSMVISIDEDDSGEITSGEKASTNIVEYVR
jgi:hypothetical protein